MPTFGDIKINIQDLLKKYDCSLENIVSITIDGGRNLNYSGKLMNNEIMDNKLFDLFGNKHDETNTVIDSEESEDESLDFEDEYIEQKENEDIEKLRQSIDELIQEREQTEFIEVVKCSSHLLQLTMNQFIKNHRPLYELAKQISMQLRRKRMQNKLKEKNLPIL